MKENVYYVSEHKKNIFVPSYIIVVSIIVIHFLNTIVKIYDIFLLPVDEDTILSEFHNFVMLFYCLLNFIFLFYSNTDIPIKMPLENNAGANQTSVN